jgi:hypothetical protein
MIHSHSRAGYSYGQTSSGGISSTAAVFAITKDTTNSAQSTKFPNSCNIQSIEVELTEISATSGITINAYLTRDSGKVDPVTPGATSGATQAITYTDITATTRRSRIRRQYRLPLRLQRIQRRGRHDLLCACYEHGHGDRENPGQLAGIGSSS